MKDAEAYSSRLQSGEIRPSVVKRLDWAARAAFQLGATDRGERRRDLEKKWREEDGRRHASLAWALNDVFGFDFWCAGIFKVYLNCHHSLLLC